MNRRESILGLATSDADLVCGHQVWRALCLTFNEEVAVKLLDLENVNCSLVILPSLMTETDRELEELVWQCTTAACLRPSRRPLL